MRAILVAMALAAAAGSAHAETRTWLIAGGQAEPAAPAGTQTATPRQSFYVEPVRYAAAMRLLEDYTPDPDHPDRKVAAGTSLFRVDDEHGAFFCSSIALREIDMRDVPTAALGAAIFGGASLRGMSRDTLWQCFEDQDGDGAFDHVGGGAFDETPVISLVKNIQDIAALGSPLHYEPAESAAMRGEYQLHLGLQFQRLRSRRDGASYAVMLCYGLGPLLGACDPVGGWLVGARAAPLPFEITALNARIVIEGVDGDGDSAQLHYRIEHGFEPHRFTIDSSYRISVIPAGTVFVGQVNGIRSRIIFEQP